MTRFVAVLALAGALTATPTLAADKAGPAIMPSITPAASSTSCYAQALGGGSIVAAGTDVLPASISAQSWSVGAGLGCDVRMDRVVIGALGRIEMPVDTTGSLIDLDKSWMVALRAGYMLQTGVMPYVLAGYESNEFRLGAANLTKDGLVVGGGLEIPLSAHLRLITEYTYSGFGKTDVLAPDVDVDAHKFRLGFSWRFNSLFGD